MIVTIAESITENLLMWILDVAMVPEETVMRGEVRSTEVSPPVRVMLERESVSDVVLVTKELATVVAVMLYMFTFDVPETVNAEALRASLTLDCVSPVTVSG